MSIHRPIRSTVRYVATVTLLLATIAVTGAVAHAAQPSVSTADVHVYDPFPARGDAVEGAWSRLIRTDQGIAMQLHTTGLRPGAYTIWWGIFNNPDACTSSPCDVADLPPPLGDGDPAAQAAVIRAAGGVVGENGIGTFAGFLGVGSTADAVFGTLTNPRGADVHLVVKYHGPLIPRLVAEQIMTRTGGCVENFGTPNCPDLQVSIHSP